MKASDPGSSNPREAGPDKAGQANTDLSSDKKEASRSQGHSHWLMIACCVPMVAIAVILVATGVVGSGFLLGAGACAAMMAAMMAMMAGGSRAKNK